MNSYIQVTPKRGWFSRWWEGHCKREQERSALQEEERRVEKVNQAYLDIVDYATQEERADHAVIDIDQCAEPKQAIQAARLALTRASTDGGNGPKLDSAYIQRLLPVLLRIEEELEGKYADVKVYADLPGKFNSAPAADVEA